MSYAPNNISGNFIIRDINKVNGVNHIKYKTFGDKRIKIILKCFYVIYATSGVAALGCSVILPVLFFTFLANSQWNVATLNQSQLDALFILACALITTYILRQVIDFYICRNTLNKEFSDYCKCATSIVISSLILTSFSAPLAITKLFPEMLNINGKSQFQEFVPIFLVWLFTGIGILLLSVVVKILLDIHRCRNFIEIKNSAKVSFFTWPFNSSYSIFRYCKQIGVIIGEFLVIKIESNKAKKAAQLNKPVSAEPLIVSIPMTNTSDTLLRDNLNLDTSITNSPGSSNTSSEHENFSDGEYSSSGSNLSIFSTPISVRYSRSLPLLTTTHSKEIESDTGSSNGSSSNSSEHQQYLLRDFSRQNSESEKLKNALQKLNNQLQIKHSEIERLIAANTELQSQIASITEENRNTHAQSQQQISELTEQLEDIKKELQHTQEKNSKMLEQIRTLEEKNQTLWVSERGIQASYDEVIQELQDSRNTISQQTASIANLNKSISGYTQKITELQNKNSLLEETLQQQQDEMSKLKRRGILKKQVTFSDTNANTTASKQSYTSPQMISSSATSTLAALPSAPSSQSQLNGNGFAFLSATSASINAPKASLDSL